MWQVLSLKLDIVLDVHEQWIFFFFGGGRGGGVDDEII